MSLYEMLSGKSFNTNKPDEDSTLSYEQYEEVWAKHINDVDDIIMDILPEIAAGINAEDNNPGATKLPVRESEEQNLRERLNAEWQKKLPQITEYRQQGYNLPQVDEAMLAQLQEQLRQPDVPLGLTVPVERFLTTLRGLSAPGSEATPALHETIQQANSLMRHLSDALEGLAAASKVGKLNWEEEVERTARKERESLVAALSLDTASAQRAEGLMFSESNRLTTEFTKFSQLKNSLLAENRLTRLRLAQYLEQKAARVLMEARDARAYATDVLLKEVDDSLVRQMSSEQLSYWLHNYHEYAAWLPAVDDEPDLTLWRANPLAVVLRNPREDDSAHTRLARAMLPVTEVLAGASVLLSRAQTRVEPAYEEHAFAQEDHTTLQTLRHASKRVKEGSAGIARKTGRTLSKAAFRTLRRLKPITKPEFRNAALLLLDEIQQAERRVKLLPKWASALEESVEQGLAITREVISSEALPALSTMLDQRLAQEAERWQKVGQQQQKQLETLTAPFTRLAQAQWLDNYSKRSGVEENLLAVAGKLAGVARQLEASAVRLAKHGRAGGKELQEKVNSWVRELNELKGQLKSQVVRVTGYSLENFSRGGMLARGIAEWAEEIKQQYLEGVRPNERGEAGLMFDRLLTALIKENRSYFAKPADPEAEAFMQRLALAMQHETENTQIYPPTAEEILASSRSVPQDIRRWAERKVVMGAFYAALRGGFNLVTGPISLPVRVVLRGGRTGARLYTGLRKMNRVRLGEGLPIREQNRFINQELSKTAIRLTLSLSPAAGWGIAASMTIWRLRKEPGYPKTWVKNVALDLPEELSWMGAFAGGHAAFVAAVRAHYERKMNDAVEELKKHIALMYGDILQNDILEDELQQEDISQAAATEEPVHTIEQEVTDTQLVNKPDDEEEKTQDPGQSEGGTSRRGKLRNLNPGLKTLHGGEPRIGASFSTAPARTASTINTQTEPETDTEEEEPATKGRQKRAAEPATAVKPVYYPSLPRESNIDPVLEKEVKELFPISGAYSDTVSNLKIRQQMPLLYGAKWGQLLYIAGHYYYIYNIEELPNGDFMGDLYSRDIPESSTNKVLRVRYATRERKWYLRVLNNNKKKPDDPAKLTVFTTASEKLKDEVKKVATRRGFTWSDMVAGKEGQVYANGPYNYIYLDAKYWPIKLEKNNRAVITINPTKVDEVKIDVKVENNKWTVHVLSTVIKATTASDKLKDVVKNISKQSGLDASEIEDAQEGAIYIQEKEQYILLNGQLCRFEQLGDSFGLIAVKYAEGDKILVIHNDKMRWGFSGEISVKKGTDVLKRLSGITTNIPSDETRKKLQDSLSADEFKEWLNMLKNLWAVFDDEFYQVYDKPQTPILKEVLKIRRRVRAFLQDSAFEYYPLEKQHNWNEALLSIYREALSYQLPDLNIIYTIEVARKRFQEAERKLKLFNTAALENKIEENKNEKIVKRQAIEIEEAKSRAAGPFPQPHTKKRIEELNDELKKIDEKIERREKVLATIKNKKIIYEKEIENNKSKYLAYNAGVAMAKKLFDEKVKTQKGINDKSWAASEVIVELALKEVQIKSQLRTSYSESELEEIKTLRFARVVIGNMLARNKVFNFIIAELNDDDIKKPEKSTGDYNDILWAVNRAGEIIQEKFKNESEPELQNLLAPMLYWLLKNNKKIKELQNQDENKITEDFEHDKSALNPLTAIKEMPEGYNPLSSVLASEYFETQFEYNEQFSTYKENYSAYEASETAQELLLTSGLTLPEMLAVPKKVIRLDVLKGTNVKEAHSGQFLFVQLQNGDWIFFSLFTKSTFSKKFTNDEMNGNPWLKRIATMEIKKTHIHGIEGVFDDEFFNNEFGNYGQKNYWDHARKSKKEKEEFIDKILFSNNEPAIEPPFPKNTYGGMVFNVSAHEEKKDEPLPNLVGILNASLKTALERSADSLKKDLYAPFILHRIASIFVPFYSTIYNYATDPEFELDALSFVSDLMGVVFVAIDTGVNIATLIKNAKSLTQFVLEGSKKGLVGKKLHAYVASEFAKQTLSMTFDIVKINASVFYDLVDAFHTRGILNLTFSKFRPGQKLQDVVPGVASALQTRKIDTGYIVKDISLKDMHKQVLHNSEVYSVAKVASDNDDLFIETAEGIFKVRWDASSDTWRVIDPQNPNNLGLGQPVQFEDGQWQLKLISESSPLSQPSEGIQTLRTDLPAKKVTVNVQGTTDVNAVALLEACKRISVINQAITHPATKGSVALPYIASFMRQNGFEDIRYRGMALFVHGGDISPVSHFVVVGNKNGRDYVFDLAAGKFENRYEELNGAIILSEDLWAQKYANISGRSLIKYGDFSTHLEALTNFGPNSRYLTSGPKNIIPNAKVLRRPSWYFPESPTPVKPTMLNVSPAPAQPPVNQPARVSSSNAGTPGAEIPAKAASSDVGTPGAETPAETSVKEEPTTRLSVVVQNRQQSKNSGTADRDMAIDLLEDAEILSQQPANALRKRLREARQFQRAVTDSDDLLANIRSIDDKEALMRIKEGELLIFTQVDPLAPEKGSRPIHVMVCMGNGRFIGGENRIIPASVGNIPQTLTAEQLANYTSGHFRLKGDSSDVTLIAATPQNMLLPPRSSLKSLAESHISTSNKVDDIANELSEMLKKSGELAPRQAEALEQSLSSALNLPPTVGYAVPKAVEAILHDPKTISKKKLATLPAGQLLIVMPRHNNGLSHALYSLGGGQFIVVNPGRLDKSLAGKPSILKASEIPNSIFMRNRIWGGRISLQKIRLESLLGKGAKFSVSGSVLTVSAPRASTHLDNLDAFELANIIRGLGMREEIGFNWASITEIKLETYFGALGEFSLGKALSYLLGKKVTAYPVVYNKAQQTSTTIPGLAKSYVPADLSPGDLHLVVKQHKQNQDLLSYLRSRFRAKSKIADKAFVSQPITIQTATGEGAGGIEQFQNFVDKVMAYIRNEKTSGKIMEIIPMYSDTLFFTKAQMAALDDDAAADEDAYVTKAMNFVAVSSFSWDLLNKIFGKKR